MDFLRNIETSRFRKAIPALVFSFLLLAGLACNSGGRSKSVYDMTKEEYNNALGLTPTPFAPPAEPLKPQIQTVLPTAAPLGDAAGITESANQFCEGTIEQGAGHYGLHEDITGVNSMDPNIIDHNYQQRNAQINGQQATFQMPLNAYDIVTFRGDCNAAALRSNDPNGLSNVVSR